MKILLCLIFTLVGMSYLGSQVIFKEPLSPRIANYHLTAKLDTRQKLLSGSEELTWRNVSRTPVQELQFHLYMNAFGNAKSTFSIESLKRSRRFGKFNKEKSGGIKINNLTLNNSVGLTDSIQFIQPDDGNIFDSTVVRIPLPNPVNPGEQIKLNLTFQTKFPQIIARTGYSVDYFLIGQWFPKIGVLVNGEWNCHQFHRNSEFFADFGVYQVDFTLPSNFVVGASGILLNKSSMDSTNTWTFRAEDVHDFALTAWPSFRQETRRIKETKVILLYAPEHAGNVSRYFAAISAAIESTAQWLMPYPYPVLTIVDPPVHGFRSSGMEYPTFVVGGSLQKLPKSFKLMPEDVTVHEFCHQYFYGILASNEFEESWLDEGFTSFFTEKILTKTFGLHKSFSTFLNLREGSLDHHRAGYLQNPGQSIVVKRSWEFPGKSYGRFSYDKPVLILQTLENYLGKKVMEKIIRTYLNRWKFRHPTTRDFIKIVNEIAPENMDWYFDQALFKSDLLDYSVEKIVNKKIFPEQKDRASRSDSLFESEIIIKRKGTFLFPVEIQVVFSNGKILNKKWDGKSADDTLKYLKPSKVIAATVDPQNKIWLDANWTNNGFTIRTNQRGFWRFEFKAIKFFQNFLATMFFF